MRKTIAAAIALSCLISLPSPGAAATLQVGPVLVDVPAFGAASKVTIRNSGSEPINAQIRVFRWTQQHGEDHLAPTRDVVASPPFAKLDPNKDQTIRIVRLSKQSVTSEESYRLVVDQLPTSTRKRGSRVNLVVRHSIPVFFGAKGVATPALLWLFEQRGNEAWVSVKNTGDRRVRVSALRVKSPTGTSVSFGEGLTGYVLGRSTVSWKSLGLLQGARVGGEVMITANGDTGPIHARAYVRKAK